MQWSDLTFAGFSAGDASPPWLPIQDDFKKTNVKTQLQEPDSILNLYRQLLQMRKSSPALQVGSFSQFEEADSRCYAFSRSLAGFPETYVLLNLSKDQLTINLGLPGKGTIKASTRMDRQEPADLSHLTLRGYEGIIVESTSK